MLVYKISYLLLVFPPFCLPFFFFPLSIFLSTFFVIYLCFNLSNYLYNNLSISIYGLNLSICLFVSKPILSLYVTLHIWLRMQNEYVIFITALNVMQNISCKLFNFRLLSPYAKTQQTNKQKLARIKIIKKSFIAAASSK